MKINFLIQKRDVVCFDSPYGDINKNDIFVVLNLCIMINYSKIRQGLLPFFLFVFISLIAQKPVLSEDFNFEIGEKYKRIKSLRNYYVASGNRLAAFKKGRNTLTVQRFSLEDLKEDVKKRQVIEDKGEFQTIMNLGGKAIMFYTIKDKAYAQKISLSGIVAEKPVLVGSDKENINNDFSFKSTYGYDAGGRINKFVFKKSFDESKFLVLYRFKTADDKADKIGIRVYDDALNLLWQRKVVLPYVSDKILNEDFAIDNEGSFYMTASIFNASDTNKDKIESAYTTEVFKIKENPTDIFKASIKIPGKSIMDAVLGLDKLGKVNVTGFYADNAQKLEVSGVFTAQLSDDGKLAQLIQSDFPAKTVTQINLKREERVNEGTQDESDKKEFENIRVNDLSYGTDGSVVIFGEQRYVESFTTSSSSGSRTTYKYYYRDIIATKLSAESEIAWMHKLPKYQMGVRGKNSMSYKVFQNKGKHYLFYVDDFTNLKRSFDEFPTKYYDSKKEFLYLTSYTIDDATGSVIKEPILTGSDIRNARIDQLEVYKGPTLTNKTMIFEAFDGKKNNLLLKITPSK